MAVRAPYLRPVTRQPRTGRDNLCLRGGAGYRAQTLNILQRGLRPCAVVTFGFGAMSASRLPLPHFGNQLAHRRNRIAIVRFLIG